MRWAAFSTTMRSATAAPTTGDRVCASQPVHARASRTAGPLKARRARGRRLISLDVEPEVHHVAVLDDVVLALSPHLAGFLGAAFAAQLDEVVEGDGFGADVALLEVGVDDAGRLGAGVADVDGPGAGLL